MGQRSVSILHFFVWEGEESSPVLGFFGVDSESFPPVSPFICTDALETPFILYSWYLNCGRVVTKLGGWVEYVADIDQADSILVQVRIQIQPISGCSWCVEWRHDVVGRLHMRIIHGSCCGVLARCLCPSLGLAPWLKYGREGVCSLYQIQRLNCSFWRGRALQRTILVIEARTSHWANPP